MLPLGNRYFPVSINSGMKKASIIAALRVSSKTAMIPEEMRLMKTNARSQPTRFVYKVKTPALL